MQKELEELQPKLVTAQDENAKMMVVIQKENSEVEARSKIVRKDEEAANEKAAEAQALKNEVCGLCFSRWVMLWPLLIAIHQQLLYNVV